MSVLMLIVDEFNRKLVDKNAAPTFVINDSNVNIVRFAVNSGFNDIDMLGNASARVMYINPGADRSVHAQTLTYYGTDGVRNYYDWAISKNVLSGNIILSLCLLETGTTVKEWHTQPYTLEVASSIHTDDGDSIDPTITPTVAQRVAVLESMIQRVASGAPIVVSSASAMTDTDQIYVLSTDGEWYYHNGTAWVAGGEYGAVATDTTLTQSGVPADAKAVGDVINEVKTNLDDNVNDLKRATFEQKQLEYIPNKAISVSTVIGTVIDPTPLSVSSYACMIYPCKAGDKFIVTAQGGSGAKAWAFIDEDNKVVSHSGSNATVVNVTVTASVDGSFISNTYQTYTDAVVHAIESKLVGMQNEIDGVTEDISGLIEDMTDAQADILALQEPIATSRVQSGAITPIKTNFFESVSHNLINPDDISTSLYYSPGNTKITTASSRTGHALTGLIEVKPGETYTVSGTAAQNTGGYFADGAEQATNQSAISSISFFAPVAGSGYCFTVPNDQSVKYVALNLRKDTLTQEVDGTYQLEVGEMATPVEPYHPVDKIKPQYLPDNGGSDETISAVDTLPRPSYSFEQTKIANFIAHNVAKDKDLVIVGTGTSLTARSSEHCTIRDDAASRPPLLHSRNFASLIWDRIAWDGQQYRRYDYPSFFAEVGTWSAAHDLKNWDDNNYRYGITRYASGPASVRFTVPTGAWQFNFIYRSDSLGTESAMVSIAEGNGKMEVFNGSTWEEANGYEFSMLETPVTLSNIKVCDPTKTDNAKVSQISYQVGGNTTYQRRLKMRCKSGLIDSRAITKAVTISATSGRLMYWGVEWSPREFMITYINAARGSHGMTYSSARSLSHFQDNEVWSFKPDLIFTENPIHNSGGAGGDPSTTDGSVDEFYTSYWGYATNNFFFNIDNPISFASRAAANGITGLEWIVFNSSITWNFGGINDDGTPKLYENLSGAVMSALDAQTLCYQWIADNETDVIAINACKYWCDAGKTIFCDLKTATSGSGKTGATFTKEGSHWNDTGSKVMARCIGGVFDFYN